MLYITFEFRKMELNVGRNKCVSKNSEVFLISVKIPVITLRAKQSVCFGLTTGTYCFSVRYILIDFCNRHCVFTVRYEMNL